MRWGRKVVFHHSLKTCSEQFKHEAILYGSAKGAALKSSAELRINRNTPKSWVAYYSTNPRTCGADDPPAAAITGAERIRQLERDNARVREERDILRRAAKHFAEETNW